MYKIAFKHRIYIIIAKFLFIISQSDFLFKKKVKERKNYNFDFKFVLGKVCKIESKHRR